MQVGFSSLPQVRFSAQKSSGLQQLAMATTLAVGTLLGTSGCQSDPVKSSYVTVERLQHESASLDNRQQYQYFMGIAENQIQNYWEGDKIVSGSANFVSVLEKSKLNANQKVSVIAKLVEKQSLRSEEFLALNNLVASVASSDKALEEKLYRFLSLAEVYQNMSLSSYRSRVLMPAEDVQNFHKLRQELLSLGKTE